MNISLPPVLRKWVEEEVATRGFQTASEFVREMIRKERAKSLRVQLEQSLIDASKSPATLVTKDDWKDIEREGLRRARSRRG